MKRILNPIEIEKESFRIIEKMLKPIIKLPPGQKDVAKRVIHATTDLRYARELRFHPRAIACGIKAIKKGKGIICDVGMVKAGINQNILSEFGGKIHCFINDKHIVRKASRLKVARAILAMQKAAYTMEGSIVAIGNAPTALFELCRLIKEDNAKPALVIGVPVGFVGAADSKKEIINSGIPYITNRGRKGGSSVAAAITNALLKMAKEKR